MRAYFAILKDAFHEALASRVLLVMLGLITLVLLATAPFSYREQRTVGLSGDSVQTWPKLIELLRDDEKKETPTPSRWILSQCSSGLQERIREFQMPDPSDPAGSIRMVRLQEEFRGALREQMKTADFYDPDSWAPVRLADEELKQLLARPQDGLNEEEIGRRNRLLMEAAYPEIIPASPPTSLRMRYFTSDVFLPLPISQDRFRDYVEEWTIWLLSWFVGVLGIGVALVISSPIVPQIFDPGSLHLLLSKPIHRWLLFLTKYIGGCAYTCLTAGYFAVGLWLILGTRFGIWNHSILVSIPVFMFLFAINYSVSALAGAIWRSPILCVVLSLVFWFSCSLLGWMKSGMDRLYIDKIRINRIVQADQTLFIANEIGGLYRWDSEKSDWREAFETDRPEAVQLRMTLGAMDAVPRQLRPFGFVYDRNREMLVVGQRNFMQQSILHVGREENEWRDEEGVSLPFGALNVLEEPDGKLVVFTQGGLYRLVGDPVADAKGPKLFGFKVPLLSRDPFQPCGPEPGLSLGDRAIAAIHGSEAKIAIFSRATITLLAKSEQGIYEQVRDKKLEIDPSTDGVIAYAGNRLLLGLENGALQLFDANTLELVKEWKWERETPPRFLAASNNGNYFSVVLHNGSLWVIDAETNTAIRPSMREQGGICAATFAGDNELLIGSQSNRTMRYDVSTWKRQEAYAGSSTIWEKAYYYVVHPLHAVLPKPGELSDTLQFLVSGKLSVAKDSRQTDLQTAQKQLDPWNPVWSGAAFLLVVLGLGCVYMQRAEF